MRIHAMLRATMTKLIGWIQTAPVTITLSVALISAAVALVVAVLTQLATSRRARRDLLTKKLEELFLLVNDAMSDCMDSYKEVQQVLVHPAHIKSESVFLQQVRSLELQKKMLMYVKLYFPQLSESYAPVYKAHDQLNGLMIRLRSGPPPSSEEFGHAVAHYGGYIASLAEEIVTNKDMLTGSSAWRRKYKRIDEPPPDAVPFRKLEYHGAVADQL
jgi:hypothetical protein